MMDQQIRELLAELRRLGDLTYGKIFGPMYIVRTVGYLASLDARDLDEHSVREVLLSVARVKEYVETERDQSLQADPKAEEMLFSVRRAADLAETINKQPVTDLRGTLETLRAAKSDDTARLAYLIQQADLLESRMARLQRSTYDDVSDALVSLLRNSYENWYTESMSMLPIEEAEAFRKEYEGSWKSLKIKAFLAAPRARSLFAKEGIPRTEAERTLYWQHPYDRTFLGPFRAQVVILKQVLLQRSTVVAEELVSSHENARPNSLEVEPEALPIPVTRKPRVFIGSSSEGLRIARAIQANLDSMDVAECVVWDQGVFGLSRGTLDALLREATTHDFAVLVLTPDDVVEKRGKSGASPRDNVLFELGLFMGKLGPDRTFMVARRNDELHLPSDLDGMIRGRFREHSTGNLRAALGPFSSELEDIIRERGVRQERLREATEQAYSSRVRDPASA